MNGNCGCGPACGCGGLRVCGLGFAFGFTWALGALIMGWLAWLTGWGAAWVNLLGSVYIGYQANWWGPIVGAVWAFVDAFITGAVIAFVYNSCASCCKKTCDKNRMSSM